MIPIAKPIRTGCYIEFQRRDGKQIGGTVIDHYYTDKGHNFILRMNNGGIHKTIGAFLYKNIVVHKPGEASRREYKKTVKRYRKGLRKEQRRRIKARRPKKRR